MKFRITVILCSAILASGCGLVKKVTGGAERQSEICEQEETRREEPRHERLRQPERYAEQDSEFRKTVGDETPAKYHLRYAMHFSGIETEHIRLASINYFPTGGIELSLDELGNEFCYPLCGKFISDYGMRSGRMHTGIDIKASPNDTIRAAFAGVVRMSKNYSGYGNVVVLRHYQGFETAYAHNSKNLVKPNDTVEAGDPIALAGRTGRATTEHLHFEVRAGGDHLDPKLLVDPQNMSLRSGKLFIRNHMGITVASSSEEETERDADMALAAKAEYDSARADALARSTVDGKPKAPSQSEPVYYRVKKNDNLSSIASRYGTTVNKLCELNKIKSNSLLQIDQRLRVK